MNAGRLQAFDLEAGYGARRVLEGVDCTLERGWTAIIGPNGAGKSTLLRALAGLIAPRRGRVLLDGVPLAQLPARIRGRRIGWLAQTGEVSGELTVAETVALGRLPYTGVFGALTAADWAAIEAAMALTECRAWRDRTLPTLSGGERQRALLARVLATEADVLLLDEPTAHLDPPHQVAAARLARDLARTRTVVTVLHDVALALAADRVLLLDGGRVRAHDCARAPALHRAIEDCFSGALAIDGGVGEPPRVRPRL